MLRSQLLRCGVQYLSERSNSIFSYCALYTVVNYSNFYHTEHRRFYFLWIQWLHTNTIARISEKFILALNGDLYADVSRRLYLQVRLYRPRAAITDAILKPAVYNYSTDAWKLSGKLYWRLHTGPSWYCCWTFQRAMRCPTRKWRTVAYRRQTAVHDRVHMGTKARGMHRLWPMSDAKPWTQPSSAMNQSINQPINRPVTVLIKSIETLRYSIVIAIETRQTYLAVQYLRQEAEFCCSVDYES